MNIDTRHEMAMNYASILGFKPGDFKLIELEKGGFALFCVDGVEYLVVKNCDIVGEDEIPARTPLGFEAMAETSGLPKKIGYSLTEVSKATGVSYSAVCRSAANGELKSYLPRGMKRGRLTTPAMIDDWLKGEN